MNAQLVPAGDFPAAAALLKHAPWPITLRFRRREPSQAEKEAWLRDPTAAGDQVSEAPCRYWHRQLCCEPRTLTVMRCAVWCVFPAFVSGGPKRWRRWEGRARGAPSCCSRCSRARQSLTLTVSSWQRRSSLTVYRGGGGGGGDQGGMGECG